MSITSYIDRAERPGRLLVFAAGSGRDSGPRGKEATPHPSPPCKNYTLTYTYSGYSIQQVPLGLFRADGNEQKHLEVLSTSILASRTTLKPPTHPLLEHLLQPTNPPAKTMNERSLPHTYIPTYLHTLRKRKTPNIPPVPIFNDLPLLLSPQYINYSTYTYTSSYPRDRHLFLPVPELATSYNFYFCIYHLIDL